MTRFSTLCANGNGDGPLYMGDHEVDPQSTFPTDLVLRTERLAILTLTFDDGSTLIYTKES